VLLEKLMTPFGIRKRLKKMLGLGGDDAPDAATTKKERPKITITLVDPDGNEETCQAPLGSSVLFATGNMARPLGSGCADATCATCRCEVLEGEEHLSPQSGRERACLKDNGFSEEMRLGCQAEILTQDETVKVRGFEFVV